MDFKKTLTAYYQLSKPGIIRGNVLTAIAGYLLASQLNVNWAVLLGLTAGFTFVIAGACAYNNYLDRSIDTVMARTQKRGLVTGVISGRAAIMYATAVSILGVGILLVTQNLITVLLAPIGTFAYVVVYGIAKRTTVHGTLVGCISGSVSLVAGYTAVVGRIDMGAVLLFLLMTAWQMPHFYGIALQRQKDYAAAKVPVMPVVYGVATTKIQTVLYIVLFIVLTIWLALAGYIGAIGTSLLTILGIVWLYKSVASYGSLSSEVWGKQVFLFSLVVMMGMALCLSFGSYLV